jgi:hypothetical protein
MWSLWPTPFTVLVRIFTVAQGEKGDEIYHSCIRLRSYKKLMFSLAQTSYSENFPPTSHLSCPSLLPQCAATFVSSSYIFTNSYHIADKTLKVCGLLTAKVW